MNGKGSKRRPAAKPGAYQSGFDEIDWRKKPTKPLGDETGPFTNAVEWVIPPLEEILGLDRYTADLPSIKREKEVAP